MFQRIIAAAVMLLAFSTVGSAIGIITFDELGPGTIITSQYLPGVIFTPGISGVSGLPDAPGPAGTYQSNTILQVALTGLGATDIGGGVSSPVSGLLLHSFSAWLT